MSAIFLLFATAHAFASMPSSPPPPATSWQHHFQGPAQNLTITSCTQKICHYEFSGRTNAPCTDSGTLTFSNNETTEATATHHIGAKNCKFEFNLNDDGSLEVEDSCVCNVATDSDLGGTYHAK